MAHILQNQSITLEIDLPAENYQLSRFDWTGKIVRFEYEGIKITGHELPDPRIPDQGLGFYNEFGIDQPIGFEEINEGEWFPKIGVGLLLKDGPTYDFQKSYKVRPAQFSIIPKSNQITLICQSAPYGGYGYELRKVIQLKNDGFVISYELINTGQKAIHTNEYVHNFLAFNNSLIDDSYVLDLPFKTEPTRFIETVNTEGLVNVGQQRISFIGAPKQPFFFSNLSGGKSVEAQWTLENKEQKISITESGSFQTNTFNLWGWGHVISPELFFQIDVASGKSLCWSRHYQVT